MAHTRKCLRCVRGTKEAQREYVGTDCAALPGWLPQVEEDEASRGVAYVQFWHSVRVILGGRCVVGCKPPVAPSSFPVAVRCWGMLEGWGYTSASHPLTQSPAEQLQMVQTLKAGVTWWALTWASNLAHEVGAIFSDRAMSESLLSSSAASGQRPAKGAGASRSCKLANKGGLHLVGKLWSG